MPVPLFPIKCLIRVQPSRLQVLMRRIKPALLWSLSWLLSWHLDVKTSNTVEQRSEQKEKRKKEKVPKTEDTRSRAWSIMSWFWGPTEPVDEMATAIEASTEAANKSVRSSRSVGGSESKSASKSTSKSTSRSQQRKKDKKGNSKKKEETKKKSRITVKSVAVSIEQKPTQFVNRLKRAKIRKAGEDKPRSNKGTKPDRTRSVTKV